MDDKAANKLSAKPTHETLMMKFKTALDQAEVGLQATIDIRMRRQGMGQVGEKIIGRFETGYQERHGRHHYLITAKAFATFLSLYHTSKQIVRALGQALIGQFIQVAAQMAHRHLLFGFLTRRHWLAQEEVVQPMAQPDEIFVGDAEHGPQDRCVEWRRNVGHELNRPSFSRLIAQFASECLHFGLEVGDGFGRERLVDQPAREGVFWRIGRAQRLTDTLRDVIEQVAPTLRRPYFPIAKGIVNVR